MEKTKSNKSMGTAENNHRNLQLLVLALIALSAGFFVFGTIWSRLNPVTVISNRQTYNKPKNSLPNAALDLPSNKDENHDIEVFNSQKIRISDGSQLRIAVFGDSMADGVWAGLYREIGGQAALYQFSKQATGLANYDYFDTALEAQKKIAEKPFDIAIVVVGTNDQMGISGRGKITPFGSPSWEKAYEGRIEELISVFTDKNIRVYWVGLPIMRDEGPQQSARKLGRLFAKGAQNNKITFIDTTRATSDASGNFSQRLLLPKENVPKILRAPDGVHFKMEGYRLMALPVIAAINVDLKASGAALLSPKSLQIASNQTTIAK